MRKTTFILLGCLAAASIVVFLSYNALNSSREKVSYDMEAYKMAVLVDAADSSVREGRYDTAISAYAAIITDFPDSEQAEKALRWLASRSMEKQELERALYYYSRLISDFPGIEDIGSIRAKIADTNSEILKARMEKIDTIEHVVVPGDNLYDLARKYDTTIALIKDMNSLKSDVIQIGQRLKINAATFSVLVDRGRNILYLKKDGEIFKTYMVATGEGRSTPLGDFKVTEKMIEPVWTKPGVGMIMPDSEEYELGARWIAISKSGYGIHGTNDESSIGGHVTAGCVRMYNSDVIELYDIIPVGTQVTIIDDTEDNETTG